MQTEKISLIERLETFAKEHGYGFCDGADRVIDGLMKKKERYGKHYCPCRVVKDLEKEENKEYNDGIVCPCIHVHDDIEKKGRCHCMLFKR